MKENIEFKLRKLLDMLGVPKCSCCGASLSIDYFLPLCPDCIKIWNNEKDEPCKICGISHSYCECSSEGEAYSPFDTAIHLVSYDSKAGRSMILKLKDVCLWRIRDFICLEFCEIVSKRIGNSISDYIVTYVPRSARSKRTKGHDQSEELAKKFAELNHAEFRSLLVNKGAVKQKTLNRQERIDNARKNFCANKEYIHCALNKNIIIIDDVITTGASICSCSRILRENGAKRIIALTIAKT